MMPLRDYFRKPQVKNNEERFILSIDGGGMRGIVPSNILFLFSQLLEEQGDTRPLADHFDLICGTSTGGLIALGMTCPVQKTPLPPDDRFSSFAYQRETLGFLSRILKREGKMQPCGILPQGVQIQAIKDLYKKYGRMIFPKKQSKLFGALFIDKYDAEPLEKFLFKLFGDTPLSEAVVPVSVVSYDALEGRPYPISSNDSHQFLFWEAARATSAAPTYFRPAFLHDRQNDENVSLLDGGVIANNPVMFAYGQAKRLYPNCKKFQILSLSTAGGELTFKINKNTGVIGWLDPSQGAPIQKVYTSAQMQAADTFARDNPEIAYTRIHGVLQNNYKMDDTSATAISDMEQESLRIFEDNKEALLSYARLLAGRTSFDQLTLSPIHAEQKLIPEETTANASETTST